MKDAAFTFWTEFLSAKARRSVWRRGNAVPSIKGADDVVLEGDYPAHAQTFLDMRDIGFETTRRRPGSPGSPSRSRRSSRSSTRARPTLRPRSTPSPT
ncbi:hypothetical protein CSX12_01905 [Microbacterium sp. Y-01]|nr:hypothetical protein CSX12_01905 [Microbacterium sp. Y-01]